MELGIGEGEGYCVIEQNYAQTYIQLCIPLRLMRILACNFNVILKHIEISEEGWRWKKIE